MIAAIMIYVSMPTSSIYDDISGGMFSAAAGGLPQGHSSILLISLGER